MTSVPSQERGVEWYRTTDGRKRYRVRWREGKGQKSRSFSRLTDARRFYTQVRASSERGERLALATAEDLSLAEFVAETWAPKARRRLAAKTWKIHAGIYDRYILRSLGALSIAQIDAEDLVEWQDDLEERSIGAPTQLKAMGILSSIMKEAARRPRATGVTLNPVPLLEKPSAKRRSRPKIFGPETIEGVRHALLLDSNHRKPHEKPAIRDAALVSLLAYAGLRPGEALALKVSSIKHEIHVTATVSDGVLVDRTKTGRDRLVPIRPALQADLDALIKAWSLKAGDLLFSSDGQPWSETEWKNWRRRSFNRATEGTPAEGVRPYDLGRHSHSALMLASGMSLPRLAEIQGHSVRILSETYTATINEYKDKPAVDPDREIAKARKKVFGSLDPSAGA